MAIDSTFKATKQIAEETDKIMQQMHKAPSMYQADTFVICSMLNFVVASLCVLANTIAQVGDKR